MHTNHVSALYQIHTSTMRWYHQLPSLQTARTAAELPRHHPYHPLRNLQLLHQCLRLSQKSNFRWLLRWLASALHNVLQHNLTTSCWCQRLFNDSEVNFTTETPAGLLMRDLAPTLRDGLYTSCWYYRFSSNSIVMLPLRCIGHASPIPTLRNKLMATKTERKHFLSQQYKQYE